MKTQLDDAVEEIINSPSILHEQYHDDFINNLYCLKRDVELLQENPNFSKYKLLKSMFVFSSLYEQFRPNKITKNDVYFGTVKKIQGIYFYLLKYIDAELIFVFSKSFNDLKEEYSIFPKRTHEEINWQLIIEDIDEICNCVSFKAEEAAVKLYIYADDNLPFYMYQLIKTYIIRHNTKIRNEDISFITGNSIVIKGNEVRGKIFYDLKIGFLKISKEE